jgi:SAM-dependent methyltransferase
VTSDSLRRAYDAIAPDYDEAMAAQPLTRWMRRVIWARLDGLFPPGARVLDLTAGTGVDACHLAGRGVAVTALDVSERMIDELRGRAAREGVTVDARVLPAERLTELDAGTFDGAFSTYAGLNTIADPARLAADLRAMLEPGAPVLLHALNRFCLWEEAAHLVLRRPTRPAEVRIANERVAHRYYSPRSLWRRSFARHFELRRAYALSVAVSPTLARTRLGRVLLPADRALGRVLPGAGHFFVLELEAR